MSAHSHEGLFYLVQPQPPPQQDPHRLRARMICRRAITAAVAVAKTESWMLAFLLAHLGQAIPAAC